MAEQRSNIVGGYEIAEAWNAMTDAMHDYNRVHPELRFREEDRVKRKFTELADLMERATKQEAHEIV